MDRPSAPAAPSVTSARTERLVAGLAMASCAALLAWRVRPALSPPSLWLDDLWVANLVERATAADLLALRAPISPLFILLERAASTLLGSPAGAPPLAIGLQVVPLLAALVAVAATGIAAGLLTRSRALAVAASALLAASVELATQAARAKSFTLDAAVVAIVLALAAWHARRLTTGSAALLAAAAAMGAPLSFASALVVPPVALLALAQRGRRGLVATRAGRAGLAAVVVAAFAGSAWLLVLPRSTPALRAYWASHALPLAPAEAARFLAEHGARAVSAAFPSGASALAGLVALLALIALARRAAGRAAPLARRRWSAARVVGSGLALSLGLVLAAGALGRYPIGSGRGDLVLAPAILAATMMGARAVLALPGARFRRGLAWLAAGAAVALLVASPPGERAAYPRSADRAVAELAATRARPEDVVLVYPFSSHALAHHAPGWPWHLERSDVSTNGFVARPDRPFTVLLDERVEGRWFASDRAVLCDQVREALRGDRQRLARDGGRVVLVATSADPDPVRWMVACIEDEGFAIADAAGFTGAGFAIFAPR